MHKASTTKRKQTGQKVPTRRSSIHSGDVASVRRSNYHRAGSKNRMGTKEKNKNKKEADRFS